MSRNVVFEAPSVSPGPAASERRALARLRSFLYLFSAALFVGTVVELLLASHYEEPVQFVPFVLCLLGVGTALWAWRQGSPGAVRALRLALIPIVAASLVGMVLHVHGNDEFTVETRPNATTQQRIQRAFTGAAPLLAPGVLVVGALIGLAGTMAEDRGTS